MAFWVRTRQNGEIDQHGQGRNLPDAAVEVSEEEFNKLSSPHFLPGGEARFTISGGIITEHSDERVSIRFSTESVVASVGDPVTVDLEVLLGGVVDAGENGTFELRLGPWNLLVDFTAGVKTLAIPTDRPWAATAQNCDVFKLENTLTIKIQQGDPYIPAGA